MSHARDSKPGDTVRWRDGSGKNHVGRVVAFADPPKFMADEGWLYVIETVSCDVPYWIPPGTEIEAVMPEGG